MNEATPVSVAPIPHHHHDHDHDHDHDHSHGHEEDWRGLPPWRPRYAPSPAAWAALFLIGLYRRVFSPVMPPACRFLPTCSAYGYEAIARYGILSGGRLALWRILRCNPFGGSGYDPVP